MEDIVAADQCKIRMNLAAIKKVDPYANDIVDTSSHVAFYIFNSEQNEWEKTDVEGAFFIYSRNAQPFHSIFIINRLNTTSFVEPITSHLELQAQAPFLLYRNERSRIRGFWFYNGEECERISKLVIDLVQKASKTIQLECVGEMSSHESFAPTTTTTASTTIRIHKEQVENNTNICDSTNVNIYKMLSHAQQEYNNSQTTQTNSASTSANAVSNVSNAVATTHHTNQAILQKVRVAADRPPTTPLKSNHSPQTLHTPNDSTPSGNVMKFFAAAKNSADASYTTPRILPLEQIEKQQRDIAPLSQKVENHMPNDSSAVQAQCQQEVTPKHLTKRQLSQQFELSQSDMKSPAKLSCSQLERNEDNTNPLLAYRSPGPVLTNHCSSTTTPDLKPLLTKKVPEYDYKKNVNVNSNCNRSLGDSIPGEQISLSKMFSNLNVSQTAVQPNTPNEAPDKPALMLPTMFEKSNPTAAVADTLPRHLIAPSVTSKLLEPLSKYQLIQAFNYLIQNDDEFVEKLHDAYLKTITKFGTYQ